MNELEWGSAIAGWGIAGLVLAIGHRHRAIAVRVTAPGPCASPGACIARTHRGARTLERCSCGAVRSINRRGMFVETGEWRPRARRIAA